MIHMDDGDRLNSSTNLVIVASGERVSPARMLAWGAIMRHDSHVVVGREVVRHRNIPGTRPHRGEAPGGLSGATDSLAVPSAVPQWDHSHPSL